MTAGLPPWARALLREGRVGRLATADAAGQPLVVPVCYAVDEGPPLRLYTAVDAKPKRTRALRRLRNIAANPRVALVVDHWAEDWRELRWVVVEGRAAVLEGGPEAGGAADLLVARYPQYRTLGLERESATVIRIEPVRIIHWRWT